MDIKSEKIGKWLSMAGEGEGNLALNCMLIPHKENRDFSNKLPGDYIEALFEDVEGELPQVDVVKRLKTHCIDEDLARQLVSVKDGTDRNEIKNIFNQFLRKRATDIHEKIKKLLAEGKFDG